MSVVTARLALADPDRVKLFEVETGDLWEAMALQLLVGLSGSLADCRAVSGAWSCVL